MSTGVRPNVSLVKAKNYTDRVLIGAEVLQNYNILATRFINKP
jgi:hypothetical protein